MSTDRDTTRIVRSWLEDGVTALPDPVLDAVLDQLPTTPQRRATWWPARRNINMNTTAKLGLAAAVVVMAAVLGYSTLVAPNVGDQPAIPSPSPTESPEPLPESGSDTPLSSGRYLISDDGYPIAITFDPPERYSTCGDPLEVGVCSGTGGALQFIIVDNVVADPCDRSETLLDPPVGPTVDDLVIALTGLSQFETSSPVEITRDGFDGKQFELAASASPSCELDNAGLRTWSTGRRINGVGPGEVNIIQVFDVNGDRLVVAAAYQPTNPAGVRAALEEAMDSIHLGP